MAGLHISPWILWLAAVVMSAGPCLAQRASPDPYKLTPLAARLQVEQTIEIKGYRREGERVHWDLWFDPRKLPVHMDVIDFEVDTEARERLVRWFRSINSELIRISNEASSRHGSSFDAETAVSCEFTASRLTDEARIGSHVCTFRGSRITYISDPPPGMGKMDPVPPAPATRKVGVDVEIRPDKLIFGPGEPISGKALLRNTGKKQLTIPFDELPDVTIVDMAGRDVERFPARVFTCGGTGGPPPVVIRPGEAHERAFRIVTDPLGTMGGYRVPEGRHRLTYPDLAARLNIPTVVRPIAIEVRDRGPSIGRRIIAFASGRERLSVLREDGLIESFDLQTGGRIASIRVAGYELPGDRAAGETFSPDAASFAMLRWSRTYSGQVLSLHPICDRLAEPRIIEIGDRSSSVWLQGFGTSSAIAYANHRAGFLRIDCDSGEVERFQRPEQFGWVSRDGRYWVTTSGLGEAIVSEPSGGEVARFDPPGRREECRHLVGLKAVYLACRGSAEVVIGGYDGTRRVLTTDASVPLAESADGRYVALGTASGLDLHWERRPGRIEVWDVVEGRRVLVLDDKQHRTACFGDATNTMVCAMTVQGGDRVSWLSDRFEVYELPSGRLARTLNLPPPESGR